MYELRLKEISVRIMYQSQVVRPDIVREMDVAC